MLLRCLGATSYLSVAHRLTPHEAWTMTGLRLRFADMQVRTANRSKTAFEVQRSARATDPQRRRPCCLQPLSLCQAHSMCGTYTSDMAPELCPVSLKGRSLATCQQWYAAILEHQGTAITPILCVVAVSDEAAQVPWPATN